MEIESFPHKLTYRTKIRDKHRKYGFHFYFINIDSNEKLFLIDYTITNY